MQKLWRKRLFCSWFLPYLHNLTLPACLIDAQWMSVCKWSPHEHFTSQELEWAEISKVSSILIFHNYVVFDLIEELGFHVTGQSSAHFKFNQPLSILFAKKLKSTSSEGIKLPLCLFLNPDVILLTQEPLRCWIV